MTKTFSKLKELNISALARRLGISQPYTSCNSKATAERQVGQVTDENVFL